MKQFISAISTNSHDRLEAKFFENTGSSPLLAHPTPYGIINAILVPMANAVTEGEEVLVTLMLTTETPASEAAAPGGCEALRDGAGNIRENIRVTHDTNANLRSFIEELDRISGKHPDPDDPKQRHFTYRLEYVFIPREDTAADHLRLLQNLFDALRPSSDNELRELYADMTYGMTPATVMTQLAYRHITQEYEGVTLRTMLYAQFIPGAKTQKLSDLSYLLHLDRALQDASAIGFGGSDALFGMLRGLLEGNNF